MIWLVSNEGRAFSNDGLNTIRDHLSNFTYNAWNRGSKARIHIQDGIIIVVLLYNLAKIGRDCVLGRLEPEAGVLTGWGGWDVDVPIISPGIT